MKSMIRTVTMPRNMDCLPQGDLHLFPLDRRSYLLLSLPSLRRKNRRSSMKLRPSNHTTNQHSPSRRREPRWHPRLPRYPHPRRVATVHRLMSPERSPACGGPWMSVVRPPTKASSLWT